MTSLIAPSDFDSAGRCLLDFQVSVTRQELAAGEVDRFADSLGSFVAFQGASQAELREIVAVAFGYEGWASLTGAASAEIGIHLLPSFEGQLTRAMAWRVFSAQVRGELPSFGETALARCIFALYAAWDGCALQSRRAYGSGSLSCGPFHEVVASSAFMREREDKRSEATRVREAHFPVDMLPPVNRNAPSHVRDDGRLWVASAANVVYDTLMDFWTIDSCVALWPLCEQLDRCSSFPVEEALTYSWWSGDFWPIGMWPLQFAGPDGNFVGYGWQWSELGLTYTRVFDSVESFKASAAALWRLEGISSLAGSGPLPQSLTCVKFHNPWAPRKPVADAVQETLAAFDEALCSSPVDPVEIFPTSNGRISLGRDVQIGDAWTGRSLKEAIDQVALFFASVLPSWKEVCENDGEISWIEEKAPFALSLDDYRLMCRVYRVLDIRSAQERDRQCAQRSSDLVDDLRLLGLLASRPEAKVYGEDAVLKAVHEVSVCMDLNPVGREVWSYYPELHCIPRDVCGALAYEHYGKNAVNFSRKHCQQDIAFVAYCTLRLSGLDVAQMDEGCRRSTSALARDFAQQSILANNGHAVAPGHLNDFVQCLKGFVPALAAFGDITDALDGSLDSRGSRLRLLRERGLV